MSTVDDAVDLEIDPGLPGPVGLYNAAARLLEVSAIALDTLVDYGLDGCPERTYVSPGLPAFDCEQLTVHAAMITEELTVPLSPQPATGSRQKARGRINLVTFTITIARQCVPIQGTTQLVDPVAEDVSARQIMSDGWALWSMLYWRAFDGTLFGGDVCEIRRPQASHVLDPSGGFGGWTLQFQTQLDGYNSQAV